MKIQSNKQSYHVTYKSNIIAQGYVFILFSIFYINYIFFLSEV